VPIEGDEVRVDGCLVTVLTTQGRRLKKLRVQVIGQGEHDDEDEGAGQDD
jgi:hypothetical protein